METQRRLDGWSAQAAAPERSVRAALAAALGRLESQRVPGAGLAAEMLLMHVLDCDRAWLYAHPERALSAPQRARYARLVARRATGEPTQYLTGQQEFWGLSFEVTPDVLIPRPETEHLIEVALERLGTRRVASDAPLRIESGAPLRVADVGTGSGCLAVALARELPHARLIATDISAGALRVARRNATRHGVRARIKFARTSVLEACLAAPRGPALHDSARRDPARFEKESRFDLIVSNPPYVATRAAASLPREVREHEPPQALFAGRASARQTSEKDASARRTSGRNSSARQTSGKGASAQQMSERDGLAFYPALIAQAEALLVPGGFLIVEVGAGQAPSVRRMLATPAWRGIAVTRDLAGIERVISVERSYPSASAERS